MRRLLTPLVVLFLTFEAGAAEKAPVPPDADFRFAGPFGQIDKASARRGFEVYRTVCSGCHGLRHVAWRNLADLGYSEDAIKALAAESEVRDGPDETGEWIWRPGRPSDSMPEPFVNRQAAAFANFGVAPPDLSLIVKARKDGANYLYALLTGYEDPPEDADPDIIAYNRWFPGGAMAMPQPLWGDDVEYADGTPATIEQEARDVTTFLAWTAEPHGDARKKLGFKVILFLIVTTALFWGSYRKVWKGVKSGSA